MIPINLIRQYHFCPRIVYYALLTNIKPIYPRQVSLGQEYHKLQERLSRNRKFKKLHIDYEEIVLDKYLENEQLGIVGKIDMALICKDEVIPVEFKDINAKKPSYSHILQLCGYGLLLEGEYEKSFRRAIVIYSNNMKLFHIEITAKIKNDFLETLKKIEGIVEKNNFPHSSANERQCSQCEYLNYCDDRF